MDFEPIQKTKILTALDAIQDLIEVPPSKNGIAEVKYKIQDPMEPAQKGDA